MELQNLKCISEDHADVYFSLKSHFFQMHSKYQEFTDQIMGKETLTSVKRHTINSNRNVCLQKRNHLQF